mgnify:CR=1 FL=1
MRKNKKKSGRESARRTKPTRRPHQTSRLVTLYGLFAALSTLTNIGSQEISIRLYQGPFNIPLSILVGTAVGLVAKYILDKRYIFGFKPVSRGHDHATFLLYSLMGVFTTFIFWGFEFFFDWLFHEKEMRYLGGIIGLIIGYVSKYQLDSRLVFKEKSQ